jgi:hypothetical protein
MSNLLQMQETLMRDDARERGYYILSLLSLSLSLSFIYHTCLRISLSLLLHGVVEQHPGAFHGAFRALDD